jgi:hypothetical protein
MFVTDIRDLVDQVRDWEGCQVPLSYRVGWQAGEVAEGIFPLYLVQADGDWLDGGLVVEGDSWCRCEGIQDPP